MPEVGREIRLKITKLLQKPGNLHNNPKDILLSGMIMHTEPFNRLIVLNHRIEPLLLKFLPIPTQIVLVVRVEQKEEVLDARDILFEFKVALACVQMVGLLFELSDGVGG
jgi:hypothetical protein